MKMNLDKNTLAKAIRFIRKLELNLDREDMINIFGEQLGDHIWFQDGARFVYYFYQLTPEQKDDFLEYVLKNYGGDDYA